MVLDFINEAELIQKAFEPYYDRTILTEGTDPNLLYDQETRLTEFHLFTKADIDQFVQLYLHQRPHRINSMLLCILWSSDIKQYQKRSNRFRKTLDDYIRLYAFYHSKIDKQ